MIYNTVLFLRPSLAQSLALLQTRQTLRDAACEPRTFRHAQETTILSHWKRSQCCRAISDPLQPREQCEVSERRPIRGERTAELPRGEARSHPVRRAGNLQPAQSLKAELSHQEHVLPHSQEVCSCRPRNGSRGGMQLAAHGQSDRK